VNTVAPAIASSAVIATPIEPTPGTWTGSPTLTYQWQRLVGTWQDIDGATTAARAPVDADWGYSLRLAEIPNGNAALAVASNATGLTAEAPVQSYSAQRQTDGDMEAANTTAFTPGNSATLSKETATPYEGVRHLRVAYNGQNVPYASSANILTIGDYIDVTGSCRGDGSLAWPLIATGSAVIGLFSGTTSATWQPYRALTRTDAVNILYEARASVTGYCDHDAVLIRIITPNTQLVAPSANMRITQAITLPVSPLPGTAVWLRTRIDSAGNWWETILIYTGSQWNITTYSVATYTRTSRLAATNIGAVTHVRLNMNADAISLYTSTDGVDFTQRDTTKTNNTYQTATGVNVLHTSDVTLGSLSYADPN